MLAREANEDLVPRERCARDERQRVKMRASGKVNTERGDAGRCSVEAVDSDVVDLRFLADIEFNQRLRKMPLACSAVVTFDERERGARANLHNDMRSGGGRHFGVLETKTQRAFCICFDANGDRLAREGAGERDGCVVFIDDRRREATA